MGTATATKPAAAAPLPPAAAPPGTTGAKSSGKTFAIGKPPARGKAIGIYGPGGIGKTSLAIMCKDNAIIDLDSSLGELRPDYAHAVTGIETWADMLECLRDESLWSDKRSITIDTVTAAEEMARRHVLTTRTLDRSGQQATSLEDYGFGKGYSFVAETFGTLFAALDAHVRAGRNVILLAHDCTANIPNPMGEDFIRYEPRLQSPKSGKDSIRLRMREWLDHLLFIGYDIAVKDGRATGKGTRTIYPVEQPFCMAKSRTLREPIMYTENDNTLWKLIAQGGK